MKKTANKLTLGLAVLVAGVTMSGGTIFAHGSTNHMYQAKLQPLNKSSDTGTATTLLTVNNNGTFTVKTTGASPSLAHAQHLHVGGTNSCPDISADKDKDGLINTTEGEPSYGPIEISLTTTGDASKDSGLAVDRFPVADASGNVTYNRTFAIPEGVTEEMIEKGVIVTHGISEITGDKAKYDGDKKSDIPGSEKLPLEATIPAACGKLVAAPVLGASTGGGSTSGIENAGVIGAGILALASGAAFIGFRAKQRNATN